MSPFGKKETLALTIAGMTCGRCVEHVTKALQETPGVVRAEVALDAGSATVVVKPGVDAMGLVAAVAAAGYSATPR